MPTVCVVRHCGTTYRSGNDVRFHKLPSEPRRRAAWLRAINRNGPQIGFVCSNHFLPEDYEMNLDVLRSLGMATKNARLRRDAVPTQRLHIASLKKRRRSEASEARPPPPWSEIHK
ncbi:hypothetical protein HPB50_001684 [Hyalomma asiaticum]|uniref:Uncharacterized protein n=1 Tax=Hyalomma asiaticum TaxID=266040 RepID=A0ACB7T7D3_HYAAI|nr:hypothetical protein HPB50_001684 [Hyalomma asiaticum]